MAETLRPPRGHQHLDHMRELASGARPPPPVAKLVGFTLTEFEVGRTVMELNAGPQHYNPMGTLHGGILCDIGDAAMGSAMATTLEDDESFTTLELKANFFKPVFEGRLRAVGQVIKRTRTLGYVECDVRDEKGSLVARLASTCQVLRGDETKGREVGSA